MGGIIVLLVGLLTSGFMATLCGLVDARNRSITASEVGKLDQSMQVANWKYGIVSTLPGRLVLYNNTDVYRDPAKHLADAGDVQDAKRSGVVLRQMFGDRFVDKGGVVAWDGTNGAAITNKVTLEGHQCLVFYLGGVYDTTGPTPKMIGFADDPLDPLNAAAKGRIGPFYAFESDRLTTAHSAHKSYPAYNDRFGTPFAYFGGTGGVNSYVGGCPSIGVGSAFPDGMGGFMNPTGFQILSAGKDRAFGNPAAWNPPTGAMDDNARDDVRNF